MEICAAATGEPLLLWQSVLLLPCLPAFLTGILGEVRTVCNTGIYTSLEEKERGQGKYCSIQYVKDIAIKLKYRFKFLNFVFGSEIVVWSHSKLHFNRPFYLFFHRYSTLPPDCIWISIFIRSFYLTKVYSQNYLLEYDIFDIWE